MVLSLEKFDKMVKEAEERELIEKVDKMTTDIVVIRRILEKFEPVIDKFIEEM